MSIKNNDQSQNSSSAADETDEDAVSLFNQLNGGDSDDSQESNDEQLDGDESDNDIDATGDEQDADGEHDQEDGDGEPSDDDDPWAQVPEPLRNDYQTLRQRYHQLENDHKANSGRVSALNRKVHELQQAMASVEQKGDKVDTGKGGPTADDLKGKSFAQVEEEWPEIADYLRQQIQQVKSEFDGELTPIKQFSQSYQEQQQQQFIQNELSRLAEAHPDYAQLSSDPSFTQWVESQPPGVQQLYESSLAADNIVLLDLYKGSRSAPSTNGYRSSKPRASNLSEFAELPRKGGGRAQAKQNPDDVDPVQLFSQIAT